MAPVFKKEIEASAMMMGRKAALSDFGVSNDLRARPQPERADGSGAGGFLISQREEVLRPLDWGGNFSQEFLQVFVALDEINF